ncbi:hypothetical protein B0H14DRAFT_3445338 [Mycena olivaceomarginata]|nr:hypothetical protein B0H14DRAFT_3445338 [Mycena olivaceomarginata]
MFSRGHIHDKTIPGAHWNVAALLELWAVSREQGDTGTDTLVAIQKECTALIKAGLQSILGRTKVAMNYENYIKSLVVDFKRMSLQSAIRPLRILYDSLKCGKTRWKVLSAVEKKQLMENHNAMVAAGDMQEKKHNSRPKRMASKRGEHTEGSKSEEEEDEPYVQEKPRKKQVVRDWGPGSRPQGRMEVGGEGDSGEDKGTWRMKTPGPPKPITQMSVAEKYEQLLRLAWAMEKSGKERPVKRKEGSGGDEGEEGRRKKKKTKHSAEKEEVEEAEGRRKGPGAGAVQAQTNAVWKGAVVILTPR